MDLRTSRVLVLLLAASLAAGCGTTAAIRSGPRAYVLPRSAKADGNTRFVLFDIGQGDAMLVVHGNRTMLVDAGVSRWRRPGEPGIGDLLKRAIPGRHIDYMVVTHYHADHIGAPTDEASGGPTGLWEVLSDGFTIGTIVDRGDAVYGKAGDTMEAYRSWLPRWQADGRVRERKVAKVGDRLDLSDELRVEVVAVNGNGVLDEVRRKDPQAFAKNEPSENDLSVALKFTQGDFELFDGGDLTGENLMTDYGGAYNDIESGVAASVGDVEVYKVDHHGSDHSTNPCFARVLDPEVSIFTTGDNRYRHPSKRVFRALSARGDVRITGGADDRAIAEEPSIRNAIVRGDVEVVVAPKGAKYWVNGRYYRSKTTAQERDRDDYLNACTEEDRDRNDGE